MFIAGSRYESARPFTPLPGGAVFPGVRRREIGPATGVIEHTGRAGDRLDLLARHYYNDGRLWWRILDANPEILHAADAAGGDDGAMIGRTIVIPRARE